jgi:2-iminobutanoate/2-iminopropanoate deaminase
VWTPPASFLRETPFRRRRRQALLNCEEVLRAAGASKDDIVETQVLLADPADFAGMNEAYAAFFEVDPPARSVAKLGVDLPGVLVSIRMTAYTG